MFFIRKIDGEDGKEPVGSSVSLVDSLVSLPRMIITPLLDIRMLLIVPLLAYSGLQQAFVWYVYQQTVYAFLVFHVLSQHNSINKVLSGAHLGFQASLSH